MVTLETFQVIQTNLRIPASENSVFFVRIITSIYYSYRINYNKYYQFITKRETISHTFDRNNLFKRKIYTHKLNVYSEKIVKKLYIIYYYYYYIVCIGSISEAIHKL